MQSLVLTLIKFSMSSEEFLQDVVSGKVAAKNDKFELPKDCSPQQGCCMANNQAVVFDKQDPVCSYRLSRKVSLQPDSENFLINKSLGMLFNITTSKRLDAPGCPKILIYETTLQWVFVSLDPTAGELNPVQNLDVRESEDLIPTIQFLEKRNSEVIQARQDAGSCERWLLISDDTGHLHPGVSSKGRFVCRIGRIIYEYSCSAILVPIVETPYCTNSIPVAARGQLFYSNIDTHMISKHMHKLPCNPDF